MSDNATTKWCGGCRKPVPPEQWAGFRCKACTAKAGKSPNRWLFDAAGNVISKDGGATFISRDPVDAPTPDPTAAEPAERDDDPAPGTSEARMVLVRTRLAAMTAADVAALRQRLAKTDAAEAKKQGAGNVAGT